MLTAYLSIGSNIEDRKSNILSALKEINKIGKITKISSFYETAAWGYHSENIFLNIATEFTTEIKNAAEFLIKSKGIEKKIGREKIENYQKYQDRAIDIDIIFWGDQVIKTENLTVPHKLMHQRKFVLTPLVEINGNFTHPVLKKNIKELLQTCKDTSEVVKI